MPYKFDIYDDQIVEWTIAETGVERRVNDGYTPSIYALADEDVLVRMRKTLAADPKVAGAAFEQRRPSLHVRAEEAKTVLRVDVERPSEVRTLAREIRSIHERGKSDMHERLPPGSIRLFNVDLTPQFRYCVETGTNPVPNDSLTTLSLGIDDRALAARDVSTLTIDGERCTGSEQAVLAAVRNQLKRMDPDVLVLSHGELVPLLYETAEACSLDEFTLGREPGWRQVARANTYESYGQVGHSPARYDVPGRAIVDESNSFLWSKSDLSGLLYLVERSWRPLQETAWGSIGTVLTSMQIRKALERDVLAPWNKWEPETFKDVATLHAADRGGFTFAPDVGLHETVYEIDFSSLYPNIICEYNVSPETVGCDCHGGRSDVPELGYAICDRPGFLPDVLAPLIEDRAAIKQRLGGGEELSDDERRSLRAKSSAIKWVLVSCFGYQGYRNAKFGRIECHEAINAYAREIMLRAKERLEAAGWRVVHGIVDSLWVTPADDRQLDVRDGDAASPPESLRAVLDDVSAAVGIDLEFEGAYEWVCFVPRRDTQSGALMRYFGKKAGGGSNADSTGEDDGDTEFKLRGIEARQRSTPPFVADCQRELLETLDWTRDPAAVCERLRRQLSAVRSGSVPTDELVITKRVSKRLGAYQQRTRTVAALQRARELGMDRHPGQSVRYVVVDDDARNRARVRLAVEEMDGYDAEFYATQLVRACESVVSPFGWDRDRIRRHLRSTEDLTLDAF